MFAGALLVSTFRTKVSFRFPILAYPFCRTWRRVLATLFAKSTCPSTTSAVGRLSPGAKKFPALTTANWYCPNARFPPTASVPSFSVPIKVAFPSVMTRNPSVAWTGSIGPTGAALTTLPIITNAVAAATAAVAAVAAARVLATFALLFMISHHIDDYLPSSGMIVIKWAIHASWPGRACRVETA